VDDKTTREEFLAALAPVAPNHHYPEGCGVTAFGVSLRVKRSRTWCREKLNLLVEEGVLLRAQSGHAHLFRIKPRD